MPRPLRAARAPWALLALMVAPGCDSLSTPAGPPPAVPVRETPRVALFLPSRGLAELDVWEADARQEEQHGRLLADIHRMPPEGKADDQAGAIRAAVDDGVAALIVMADEPSAVAPALDEARSRGIPVVLLERPVPLGGPEAPLVTYDPARVTAKALVDAALADAKAAGFPPQGPAAILVHERPDDRMKAEEAALREELEGRGVRVLPPVPYDGGPDDAASALRGAMYAAPHLAMVFAEDDSAVRGAAIFRHGLDRAGRRFVLAGYTHERVTMDLVRYNIAAALVDRNVHEPIRRAFAQAAALASGETTPARDISPTPVSRASGKEVEGEYPPFLAMHELRGSLLEGSGDGMPSAAEKMKPRVE